MKTTGKIFLVIAVSVLFSGCDFLTPEDDLNGNNERSGGPIKTTDVKNKAKKEGKKYVSEEEKAMEEVVAENSEFSHKFQKAIIKTNLGGIEVEFFNDDSPQTVGNFIRLAQEGFYDEVKFHRVIADFMIQSGDPNSKDDDWSDDGMGGPGYQFKDEINDHKLVRGSLAMANSGPNTNGSQFFIVTAAAAPWLDGKHTNFGRVVDGMDVVENIESVDVDSRDHPIQDIVIERISFE